MFTGSLPVDDCVLTPAPEAVTPMRHEKAVARAQFSPDGRFVVTASDDNTARVWEAQSGKPVGEPMRHEHLVYDAQFSSDGRYVVTASFFKIARVWEAQSGKPVSEPMRHEDDVNSAQFSPDGRYVVTASQDNTARVWTINPVPGRTPSPLFLRTAIAIAGRRVGATTAVEPAPPDDLAALRKELSILPDQDPFVRIAKWLLADRQTRTIEPFAEETVPQWVEKRVAENTLESLFAAVEYAPDHPLALARLAVRQMDAKTSDTPGCGWFYADRNSRRALELAPTNPEVQTLRKKVLELAGKDTPNEDEDKR
ncbi:MAG: hypothetical protein NTX50_18915 [Candidatus Sumerlaeota bacterium]|nr:hypothetical protein [Candidatus Sumerlaeota bacterium]